MSFISDWTTQALLSWSWAPLCRGCITPSTAPLSLDLSTSPLCVSWALLPSSLLSGIDSLHPVTDLQEQVLTTNTHTRRNIWACPPQTTRWCYCHLSCRDLFLNETRMMRRCSCFRCVHGSWIKWNCPDHALHYWGGLREGHYCRTDGLVLPDGCHVHHWCWSVCSQDPWALLSWQMWHLGKHSMILPMWLRRYLKSLFSWI